MNHHRFLVRFGLILLLTLPLVGPAAADSPDTQRPAAAETADEATRVALGVRVPRHVEVALLTAHQLYDGQGLKADQVNIVVCGPGTELLTKEGPLSEEIRRFTARGGRLAACGLTLQELDIDPASLLPEVDVVANGFIELLRLQTQGFHTIEL